MKKFMMLLLIVVMSMGCLGGPRKYGVKISFSWKDAKTGDIISIGFEPYVYILEDDGSLKKTGRKVSEIEKKIKETLPVKCEKHPECWIIAGKHFVKKTGKYVPMS